MSSKQVVITTGTFAALVGVFLLGQQSYMKAVGADVPTAVKNNRVFELRTYTAVEGKLDKVLARFRDHTAKLFAKHGMTNVGYWVPADEPRSKDTLIYLLAHDSREAAQKSWAGFRSDPDWIKARTESEVDGRIVAKLETVYLNPTDFSAMK